MQFWISFLPEAERTLRPTGIHLFNIRYWSPALAADRTVHVRRGQPLPGGTLRRR
ncbi:Mu transposase C-terminal domain-containing protein [Mesorhizobium amorphae]|uniref:Mu transposase C-terminal domain-containing protein n=1 Tax=Mesorhizobium amorphae TaxID=71433 RepID=UPI001FEF4B6F|nr:Mu transposase C-terminal domain-containing protein [Mesorhizobium amorphae]